MSLAKSDGGWISGVASDDVVTIGDPRLKAETKTVSDVHEVAEVAELLVRMVDRLRELNGSGLAPSSARLRHVDHCEDPLQVVEVGCIAGGQGEPVSYGSPAAVIRTGQGIVRWPCGLHALAAVDWIGTAAILIP